MARTQLRQNKNYQFLSNMILFTEVLSTNLYKSTDELVEMSKREGGLYGDQGRYIATDCPTIYDWTGHNQTEANNLLKLFYGPDPQAQQMVIDTYKVIPLTVDNYLSKQAFSDEYSFSTFTSQMLSYISEVKNIYEKTMFLTYVGTTLAGEGDFEDDADKQNVQIELPQPPDSIDDYNTESYNRIVAQTIATEMADLIVDLEDINRDYNDLGFLHGFNSDDFVFVWNAEWVNKINKLDVPTIFHKDGLIDKFAQYVRHPKFFGNKSTKTTAGLGVRSLITKDFNEVPMNDPSYDKTKYIIAGDLVPEGVTMASGTTYEEDGNIICKIYHKRSLPLLTAFSTMTDFFNGASLTNTQRLIFGHSTLDYIKDLPFITVKVKPAV